MELWLIVGGGALGALARYGIGGWVQDGVNTTFPWGTLLVNASGSFLLGCIMRLTENTAASANWRAGLAIGFCGAYTTFSTFSYETARLLQERQWGSAFGNVTANVMTSLVAVFAGFALAAWVFQAKG